MWYSAYQFIGILKLTKKQLKLVGENNVIIYPYFYFYY